LQKCDKGNFCQSAFVLRWRYARGLGVFCATTTR